MWYAISGLGILVIVLLVRVAELSSDVCKVKYERCPVTDCKEYVSKLVNEKMYYDDIHKRHSSITDREARYNYSIQNNMEKQLRLAMSFCDFKNEEVTIKDVLKMLLKYLGLTIKPSGNIEIV